MRNLFERLNEAAEAAEVRRTGGARRWSPPDDRRSTRAAWNADDFPDLSPIATWVLAGLVVLFALGVAGSLATAWETVLLWQNRVPFSTDGLGHRPDLRPRHLASSCSSCRSCGSSRRCSTAWSSRRCSSRRRATSSGRCAGRRCSRRRSACTWRSSAACSCSPSRSATSSTSSSWCTAREAASRQRHRHHRRQLHRPERPVPRLRRADRAVRAGGGVPRGRCLHPHGLAARADARRLVPGLDPHRPRSTRRPCSTSRCGPTSSRRKSRTSRTTSR